MTIAALEKAVSRLDANQKIEYLMDYIKFLLPETEPASLLATECGFNCTRTEGRYLHALSSPLGRILSAEQFRTMIHLEARGKVGERTPVTHIKRLRKKLAGTGLVIETHYGIGWRLVSDGTFTFPWSTCGETAAPCLSPKSFIDHLQAVNPIDQSVIERVLQAAA